MAFYETHGRTNYYMTFGEGRPVLLLHGISNSGRAWAPQIPELVAAGYRVIAPDHAGHGASSRLSRPLGVSDLADDARALIDTLGIDSLDVVGLSLGGMVALEMALRQPERVSRLVIANSFDKTATLAFRTMAESWATTFEQMHGPLHRLEQNWPSLVSPAFQSSAEGMRTYQVWHGIAAGADGASLAHVARGIVDFDRAEEITSLAMPTLFIAGELDRMSTPQTGLSMAGRAPHGRFHLIEGAAHISNVDSAAHFTSALLGFLGVGNGAPPPA